MVFHTFVRLVASQVRIILLFAGLSVGLLFLACQKQPNQSAEQNLDSSRIAPSITAQVVESLNQAKPPELVSGSAPLPALKRDSIKKKAQSLPPPKKEPWMDTLTDLTGITPPNAAALLSEDPVPLNKSSVELLIASHFQNRKPEELLLRVYVSESGAVLRYQLLQGSNPRLGPEYFVRPLLELRFTPARQGQKSVAAWTTIKLQIPSAL